MLWKLSEGVYRIFSMKARPVVWAIALGATGFVVGFSAPLIFQPDSPQGPLLGIFITGPIAFAVGGLLGALSSFVKLSPRYDFYFLIICSVAVAGFTLHRSRPEPRYIGYIIDAEVRDCKPVESADTAKLFAHWDKVIVRYGYVPKPNWKVDVPIMLKNDNGVILNLFVFNMKTLYENRTPWDNGQVFATEWIRYNGLINYYDRSSGSSCSSYIDRSRKLYFPRGGTEYVQVDQFKKYATGPNTVSDFLRLPVLHSVPQEYQLLVK